jgi:leader peptidase (prepilin peptidase) / N-methyltransferase
MLWVGFFVLGLFVGSFLNVVVLRLHAGKDFVKGRSECPKCHHRLSPLELIPLFSWIALRGRCKNCHKPISAQYPLVELATGVIFAITVATQAPHSPVDWLLSTILLVVVSCLIILAVYDLKWYLLPDKVLLPLVIPALLIAAISSYATHSRGPLIGSVSAAILFGGFFYGIAAVSDGKWMGGGDIKLAFVMGLLLGVQKTLLAMLIAFNSAAIIGVTLILLKRKTRRDLIPFGPFLIAGTLVALWYGGSIIDWYVKANGLNLL